MCKRTGSFHIYAICKFLFVWLVLSPTVIYPSFFTKGETVTQATAVPGVLLSCLTHIPAAARCLRDTVLSLLTAHHAQKPHGRDWQTQRKQRLSYGSRPSDAVPAFCPRLHSYVSPETRGRSQCANMLLFAHDFPSPPAHWDWFFKNHLSTWPLRVINH